MVMASNGLSRNWPPQDYRGAGDQDTKVRETPAPTPKSPRNPGPSLCAHWDMCHRSLESRARMTLAPPGDLGTLWPGVFSILYVQRRALHLRELRQTLAVTLGPCI